MRRRCLTLLLVTLLVTLAPITTLAPIDSEAADDQERFGVKLLDAPVSRRDDPRADVYIIDHVAPRTVIRRRIQVTNQTSEPLHLDLYPAAASIDHGEFIFAPERTPNELTTWTSLDTTGLDIPAGAAAIATVTIAVPVDASAGERYAVIWAQAAPQPTASGTTGTIDVVQRVGVRVYLDVGPGGEPPSDFEIAKLLPERTRDGRPRLRAQVHNTGGRALDVSGSAALDEGPGGIRAGPFPVQPSVTLAPGETATVTVALDPRLPDGPWTATLTLKSGMIERVATATITLPDTPGTTGQATHHGLFRWPPGPSLYLLAAAVAAATALAIGVYRRTRRRTHHAHDTNYSGPPASVA